MEDKDDIIIEDTKVIDEQIIDDEPYESLFDKAKKQKDAVLENYRQYSKSEEVSDKTTMLQNIVSWDTIKILIYLFIMSFIINDFQNFLFSLIIALLLIKIDILEPIFRFIRSLLKR